MKKLWARLPYWLRATILTVMLVTTALTLAAITNEADSFIGDTFDSYVKDHESNTGEKFENLPTTAGTGAAVVEFERAQTDEEKADAARAEFRK